MRSLNCQISTHVLDTNKGLPVSNLLVKLYKRSNESEWILLFEGKTESNGRMSTDNTDFTFGTYKLKFEVKEYYASTDAKTIYPFIDVIFDVDKAEHYHIPLLLNAFGYTTYRGS